MTVKSSDSPRYAPYDPSLPKPWRALVDGRNGNLYFWNPLTKVTQYERPSASEPENRGAQSCSAPSSDGPAIINASTSGSGQTSLPNPRVPALTAGNDSPAGLSAEAYRRHHEITVIGNHVPPPYTTFQSAGFPSEILRELQHAGFSAPTPIQAQSWPIALDGRDIVAVAKTGSGKTLGYLIPGFIRLKKLGSNSQMGPLVLVLSPTRELATQIQDEAVKFGRSSRVSSVCLYGGAPKGPQLRDLSKGAHVVVATPGRLNDILEMKKVSLHQVSYLVLDEADRMLDMGFEPQIRRIVKEIPPRRQTLMYTATWPKEVRKIAADLLVNPVQVNIGSIDELVANKSITQHVEMISPMEKRKRLEQILHSQEPGSKIIIFCSTKRMCDQLARNLGHQFGANAIHGDKSQNERDLVLNQFRTGKSPILVATDVAARGLDIKDIRVVINYDFPTGVEDYVHRIGRTGRAGATGVSYTFLSDQDARYASDLVKVLEGADQCVPSELRDMAAQGGYGGRFRRWRSDSGAHDRVHSYGGTCTGSSYDKSPSFGGVCNDSSYDKGGGWGQPLSSGWSDSFCNHRPSPPFERCDHSGGKHLDSQERGNMKTIQEASNSSAGCSKRSRSRSRSRSPSSKCHGWGVNLTADPL
ncbi:DEAD-box ATP-dependent RNA helicase 14-like [Dioscorea cayenensis subsp. rotundata]|uniref:RNA helicase n=1 Tax=Dioscorea cayennensis subsp. rotundata TaxID=55577 RepID=A0AB40CT75_DIOCR|nr:DEAD-box ATP-dependent RNA helicase 14-like [Dioscorea cayenensis subsp. rotundata]